MPICEGCGGSFDENFKFCPYCGRAKPALTPLEVNLNISLKDVWETCRIYMAIWDGAVSYIEYQFYAEAIGPNGKYIEGESPTFRKFLMDQATADKGYIASEPAHRFLVNQLISDGWEAIPSGGQWWETQFRRRVIVENLKPWELWILKYESNPHKKWLSMIFTLSRINGTKKIRGKDYPEYVFYGQSREFKGKVIGSFRSEESLCVLEEFTSQMTKEGFIPVSQAVNEQLKKCLCEKTDILWFYRCFIKRK
ncbi:hypothetical protein KJ742_07640 [Patescibacteria group bacterium]|nr:hypothetical protein [Patescibacteria group bacterium]MBU1934798.1 hypothetical protein [Patescibacteria group bacterium]